MSTHFTLVRTARAVRCFSVLLGCIAAHFVSAADYYVDSSVPSDGAGTQASPWKTLARVNSGPTGGNSLYQPGDRILFKSGGIWNGQLWPRGSGVAGSPIRIDKYGGNVKPQIIGVGHPTDPWAASAVLLYNQAFWHISNLDVSNPGTPSNTGSFRTGILVLAQDYTGGPAGETGKVEQIYIRDCYVHDIEGRVAKDNLSDGTVVNGARNGGIYFRVNAPTGSTTPTWFHDVLIERNHLKNVVRDGIRTGTSWSTRPGLSGSFPYTPPTKVRVRGNYLESIAGDGIIVNSAAGTGTNQSVIEYNVSNLAGNNPSTLTNNLSADVSAGIWTYNCDDIIVQFNEAYNHKSQADGEGFDIDALNRRNIYQYNYSHDNQGGAFSHFAHTGGPNYNRDNVVRYNLFVVRKDSFFSELVFFGNGTGDHRNLHYYNNVFHNQIPPGATSTTTPIIRGGSSSATVKFTNNIIYNERTNYDGSYPSYPAAATSANWTFSHNIFYNKNVPPASEPPDANKYNVDPQFVAPGTSGVSRSSVDGYKLRYTSPALNSGTPLAAGTNGGRDYWGFAVPNDGTTLPNRGAYNGPALLTAVTTKVLVPVADATVRDGTPYSSENYGTERILTVKDGTIAGFTRRAYLRFDLTGLATVTNAKLRVTTSNSLSTGTDLRVVSVTSSGADTWSETGLWWSNAPASNTTTLDSVNVTTNGIYDLDVTAFVQTQLAGDKMATLVIEGTGNQDRGVDLYSKDNIAGRPELVVVE